MDTFKTMTFMGDGDRKKSHIMTHHLEKISYVTMQAYKSLS